MDDKSLPRLFSRYPMLLIASYFSCGVFLARFVIDIFPEAAALGIFTLLLIAVFRRQAYAVIVPVLFIPLGYFCYQIERASIAEHRLKRIYDEGRLASGEPVVLEGTLTGPTEPASGGWRLHVRAEKLLYAGREQLASGIVRLSAPVQSPEMAADYNRLDLRRGSRIRFVCRLQREAQFLNPGVASRHELLDQQGLDAVGTIKSPLAVEKLGQESSPAPLDWIYKQRQMMIESLRRDLSPSTAGVLIASLLGDKYFLDRRTAEVFRDGGTYHVLVISGLHITVIGGIVLFVVSFFTRNRLAQFIVASAFLWAFSFAVGAEAPVVRACVMFTILLFARVIYRSGSQLNSLGTCVLILLAWRPSELFSASFQLTVVSVAAIVACGFPLVEKLRSIGKWTPSAETPFPADVPRPLKRFCELLYWNEAVWQIESSRNIWSANLFKSQYFGRLRGPNLKSALAYIFEGLVISVVVQLWLLPFLVIYFHRVSPASLLLNLWVGVLLALESFTAVAAVLLSVVSGWLAAPLFAATEFLNAAMMLLPSLTANWDVANIRPAVYSGPVSAVYFIYFACVILASACLFKWDPFRPAWPRLTMFGTSLAAAALLAVIIFHPFSSPAADGRLRIDFLDVGQGDSALVTSPDGETMLVDGGGRASFFDEDESGLEPDIPRIGEVVVSEFLWEKGYSRIDRLVATHADTDHIQGLADVAENFAVGEIILSQPTLDDPESAELMAVVRRKAIPLRVVADGDELAIGGASIRFLNPPADVGALSTNNSSIVMRVGFGSRAYLLTGDIERETEARLLGINADVVKVAHHGSRTSSTEPFVQATGAEWAIVPVGRRSRFGHPHPEVVERWRSAGSRVLTTGEKGTVTVSTDGIDLTVGTFLK